MLTPITYGYEKGSTSGNEIFRSLFFLLPCPLSLVLFLFGSAYALTRWSLVECFSFRVAVYVCVFVFLRKDNT